MTPPVGLETEAELRRKVIKNKILAIGRISRVFQVLREESESVSELKTVSGNPRLPPGTLMLGSEGIKDAITGFEDARRLDIRNERLPPNREEVDRIEHEAHNKAVTEAVHRKDPKLEALVNHQGSVSVITLICIRQNGFRCDKF